MTDPPTASSIGEPRRRRLLAAADDALDPSLMSGLPYYMHRYGTALGVLDGAVAQTYRPAEHAVRRVAWNGWRVVTGRGRGGYQYSKGKVSSAWPAAEYPDATVLNVFQLYPERTAPGQRRWYFLDQTLLQLFTTYGQDRTVSLTTRRQVMEREREGYLAAAGVVVNSPWAAESCVRDYGLDPAAVHVVPQSANLDRDVLLRWHETTAAQPRDGVLRIVYAGYDWRRKGLDRLLAGCALAEADGVRLELRVIGVSERDVPADVRRPRSVRFEGRIDKTREMDRFVSAVGWSDVGCLLSRAEAGGNFVRECHAVGRPVLVTDVGGLPAQVIEGAGQVLGAQVTAEEVAEALTRLASDRANLDRMTRAAQERWLDATWDTALRQLDQILRRAGD